MICNYSASPVFVSNRDGELAYRTGLRQIPVKAWGRSPPDFPQRAMPCIASRGKLNSHNDSKENSLLFKLNLFLLSYPHILSLPPKGAGSPAKKPVSPAFLRGFAWGRSFCFCPHCSYSGQGDRYKRTVPLNQNAPLHKYVQGGAAFQGDMGTVLLFPSPLFLFRTRGQKRKDRPLKSNQEKMGLIASERLSFSACAAARSLPRVV